jgi:glucokinase
MKVSIGIDVGGSHVGIGFLDMDGVLLLKSDVKINGMVLLSDQLVHAIVNLIQKNCNSTWEISSIGVGCPGQAKNGVIVAASNIPLIRNMPLVDILSQIYKGIPIVLLNDADAALAAEMWGFHKDAYANIKNAALITLGTGIGCGLMIDGKLYHGSNGLIEAGHMIVSDDPRRTRKCGCGQSGCVEVYASATNTAKRFLELNKESAEIVIAGDVKASEEAHAEGGTTEVFDRYFKHDTKAVKVVEEVSMANETVSVYTFAGIVIILCCAFFIKAWDRSKQLADTFTLLTN